MLEMYRNSVKLYTFSVAENVYIISFADGVLRTGAAVGPGGPGKVGPGKISHAQTGPGQVAARAIAGKPLDVQILLVEGPGLD